MRDSARDTSGCPPCRGTSTSGDVSVCTAAIAEKGNAATGHSFSRGVQRNKWKLNIGKSSECKASVDSGEKRCNGAF